MVRCVGLGTPIEFQSDKRVARLMREAGLYGVSRRKWIATTRRRPDARPAPDLVERDFMAAEPDQLYVADITYVPTWAGFLFLAVVLDACTRRIVGWAMANHLRTELVLAALNMALHQRQPSDVIHHSDQGTQYTSISFGRRCKQAGVRPSMGSVGDCYDNAMCESFFATLECASSSIARPSAPMRRRSSRSSSSSRAGTTRTDAIPRSTTCHPSITKGESKRLLKSQVINRPRKRGNSNQSTRPGNPFPTLQPQFGDPAVCAGSVGHRLVRCRYGWRHPWP